MTQYENRNIPVRYNVSRSRGGGGRHARCTAGTTPVPYWDIYNNNHSRTEWLAPYWNPIIQLKQYCNRHTKARLPLHKIQRAWSFAIIWPCLDEEKDGHCIENPIHYFPLRWWPVSWWAIVNTNLSIIHLFSLHKRKPSTQSADTKVHLNTTPSVSEPLFRKEESHLLIFP
jgi:hypothetical protein